VECKQILANEVLNSQEKVVAVDIEGLKDRKQIGLVQVKTTASILTRFIMFSYLKVFLNFFSLNPKNYIFFWFWDR
jgi:hypothetical protein